MLSCALQVLIKKQQERLQLEQPQRGQLKQSAAPQRSLLSQMKVQAAPRPQGSPAACLTLALPAPGWHEQ